jgi:hypothetical protein
MSERRFDRIAFVQLLTIILVAIVLVPVGSHLASLISKMRLSPEQYMTAQRAYDSWSLFGIPIIAALVLTLWHSYLVRGNGAALLLSLISFLCLAATQVIFWVYTLPMNAVTQGWTVMPDQFETVRRQWEYSHAVSAVLAFAALITITLSALVDARARAAERRA